MSMICIAICIILCRLFRASTAGGRFCCWGRTPESHFDAIRKEVGELKDEIGKMKKI
jgi:hypothetical protein